MHESRCVSRTEACVCLRTGGQLTTSHPRGQDGALFAGGIVHSDPDNAAKVLPAGVDMHHDQEPNVTFLGELSLPESEYFRLAITIKFYCKNLESRRRQLVIWLAVS